MWKRLKNKTKPDAGPEALPVWIGKASNDNFPKRLLTSNIYAPIHPQSFALTHLLRVFLWMSPKMLVVNSMHVSPEHLAVMITCTLSTLTLLQVLAKLRSTTRGLCLCRGIKLV